jgi:hypothetical protein
MRPPAVEFLRRFVAHVLPDGFQRIRHHGLHANRRDHATLERCRALLGAPPPAPAEAETVAAAVLRLTGVDVLRCPACGQGRVRTTLQLLPSPAMTSAPSFDT